MIHLIVGCSGKAACPVFSSPEDFLDAMTLPHDFANLMTSIEIVKRWRACSGCPFKVHASPEGATDDDLRRPICSLASRPPFSMDAVSRATGYSKTRVAQIEYTAIRKMKQKLGPSMAAVVGGEDEGAEEDDA